MVQDWESIVAKKQEQRLKSIPKEWVLSSSILDTIKEDSNISVLDIPSTCGILTSEELEITGKHDAVDLVKKMASKKLSSLDVTTAFCKRAAIAHQVVGIRFPSAFGLPADHIDQLFDRNVLRSRSDTCQRA